MAKVKNTTEALKQVALLIERQSELAAGIRDLGSPDLEPLARWLEDSARLAEQVAEKVPDLEPLARRLEDSARPTGQVAENVRPLEDAETLAIRRVRSGQVTGSTSIEDFADEYGLTEADLTR